MNLIELLQQQAETRPNAVAIAQANHQAITFGQLEHASIEAASFLQASGLQAGDAVLIIQPMSIALYVALLGIWRLGLVAMFVDPSVGKAHLDRCCELYPPQGLIASSKAHLLRLRSPALQQIPHKFAVGLPVWGAKQWPMQWRDRSNQIQLAPAACTAETPALITFTSGSTGAPKAALRTQGFLLAQHQAIAANLHLQAGETDLTTLPMFPLANLASGVTSVIPDADLRFPGRINAAKVTRQIQTYQPQTIAASPALLARLADYCERHRLQLASFDRLYSGGAPVFPNLLARLQTLAPQAEVHAVYGSTEAEPIAHIARQQMQPADFALMQRGKGLLVGTPVSEATVRILPPPQGAIAPLSETEFEAACLATGEAGEIVVAGDHVLSGYLHGQGDAETKFRVGDRIWHRTGDAGYLDAQGRLWLLGRCGARIADDRGVLYPFAIEAAVSQHPAIRRSALVRVQNQRWLIIETTAPVAIESLQTLLSWAQIEHIQPVRSIPVDRRHNAKVDYPKLNQLCKNWRSVSTKTA